MILKKLIQGFETTTPTFPPIEGILHPKSPKDLATLSYIFKIIYKIILTARFPGETL